MTVQCTCFWNGKESWATVKRDSHGLPTFDASLGPIFRFEDVDHAKLEIDAHIKYMRAHTIVATELKEYP